MAFIDQWADHDAHREKEEDLKATNPCDRSWRFIVEDNGLIIGLEYTVRLGIGLVEMREPFI